MLLSIVTTSYDSSIYFREGTGKREEGTRKRELPNNTIPRIKIRGFVKGCIFSCCSLFPGPRSLFPTRRAL
jgi:hypothetical protein